MTCRAAPVVVVAVTAHGDLGGRPPVLRSGARAGDVVALAGAARVVGGPDWPCSTRGVRGDWTRPRGCAPAAPCCAPGMPALPPRRAARPRCWTCPTGCCGTPAGSRGRAASGSTGGTPRRRSRETWSGCGRVADAARCVCRGLGARRRRGSRSARHVPRRRGPACRRSAAVRPGGPRRERRSGTVGRWVAVADGPGSGPFRRRDPGR